MPYPNRLTEVPAKTLSGDLYISADVETDGPIPGPYSMLSFALVAIGVFDGQRLHRFSLDSTQCFYRELKPISENFQEDALRVNRLDRERLVSTGDPPQVAMQAARQWVVELSHDLQPVLVAYPLAFDWAWLYWYFTKYCTDGSPFGYSSCIDIKTMIAVKRHCRLGEANRDHLPSAIIPLRPRTHNALDDAKEQAELFANLFDWRENAP